MNIKEKADRINKQISVVFIALKNKETPLFAKIAAGITVAYALSPIDFIPDFIPILGYLDDCIILPALITLTVKLIPKNIWNDSKNKANNVWKDGKPKKWYYAIPIIVVWIAVFTVIMKIIL